VQLNAVLTSGKLRESNKSREACADDRIDHSGPAAYSAWVAEAGSYEDRRTARQRGRALPDAYITMPGSHSPTPALLHIHASCTTGYTDLKISLSSEKKNDVNIGEAGDGANLFR